MHGRKFLAVMGLMTGVAHAASFTESTSADAKAITSYVATPGGTPGVGVPGYAQVKQDSYSGAVPKSTLTSNPGGTSSLPYSLAYYSECVSPDTCGDGWAYSSADVGALHLADVTHSGRLVTGPSTSSSGLYYTTSANATANSQAHAVDSFVLGAKSMGFGQHGWLTYAFDLGGTMGATGINHGQSGAQATLNLDTQVLVSSTLASSPGSLGSSLWTSNLYYHDDDTLKAPIVNDRSSDGTPSLGVHVMKIPVLIGSTVSIDLAMQASSYSSEGSGCEPVGSQLVCHDTYVNAQVDFSHTLRWGGIVSLTDDQGNLITDFSAVSTDTGFKYANAAAVPEPTTTALFGCGVLVLLAAARQGRGQHRRESSIG